MSDSLEKFEDIVARYQRDIVNFHYRLTGNRYEAEDLAQETFVKAYKNLYSLKEPAKIKSWLFSIARNITIDFFRKNKDKSIALDSTILENYARATAVDHRDQVLKSEISRELEKCIEKLSPIDQMIVKLLYYEGFSYKEIGTLLNINQNTLKSRLHRAREALLNAIQANELLQDLSLKHE